MKERLSIELLTATSALAWFKYSFLPSGNLLAWVFIAMLVDLVTGIIKAWQLNEARTSAGYRKTVIKFTQYAGAVVVGVILGNALPQDYEIVSYVNDGLLVLLIYIEATSIFENLYAIDSTSQFSKYFIAPILRVLTFAIKKSPLAQQNDKDESNIIK